MSDLRAAFEERYQEIVAYLDFLEFVEAQLRNEQPRGFIVTPQQQRILYSSVYIHLYNLIEATGRWCLEAVEKAALGGYKPAQLSAPVLREWIRWAGKTHSKENADDRLDASVELLGTVLRNDSLSLFRLDFSSGNWDDKVVQQLSERIGCTVRLSTDVDQVTRQFVRDRLNLFSHVKDLRNKLAHGRISFTQCGEDVTASDLREFAEGFRAYLFEVIESIHQYIDSFEFLSIDHRPNHLPT